MLISDTIWLGSRLVQQFPSALRLIAFCHMLGKWRWFRPSLPAISWGAIGFSAPLTRFTLIYTDFMKSTKRSVQNTASCSMWRLVSQRIRACLRSAIPCQTCLLVCCAPCEDNFKAFYTCAVGSSKRALYGSKSQTNRLLGTPYSHPLQLYTPFLPGSFFPDEPHYPSPGLLLPCTSRAY
jgi:hypothetical protein